MYICALSCCQLQASVPEVDFCGWNPFADCTDFSFHDQTFLDKCKAGDPVSHTEGVVKYWAVEHLKVFTCVRPLYFDTGH